VPAAPEPLENGRFGPILRGGRVRTGGPDWRRLGVLSLVLVLGMSSVVGAATAGVLLYGNASIERIAIPEVMMPGDVDGDGEPDIEELTEVLNVLVVGTDTRDGLTEEQLLRLGTEEEDGLRTDTIMLLQLDPRRDGVSVISFPRDLLVTRCDGSRGRINAAFAIGERQAEGEGPSCLVRTVTDFTGVPVNHFVQVDLVGFVDIVDSLGGVSVFLDEPIRDVAAGADFPAGCVTMDGIDALSFVRIRRIDNDFGRIARQQRFIREVVNEAASVGTLANPPRLFSLVDAAARAVSVDDGLSANQMRRIAFSLRDLGPEGLDTRTVPSTPQTINGAAFVVADEEASDALFSAFREGTLVPDEVVIEEPEPIGADDVPAITILNGAGIQGLAQEALDALEAAGFTIAETGNADSFEFTRTQVVYPADLLEEAEVLAEALGGASLVADEDDTPLRIVLGSDFDATVIEPRAEEAQDDAEGGIDGLTDPEATPTPTPTPEPTFAGAAPTGSC
jgi:LCP family protein required for cell wall assembly